MESEIVVTQGALIMGALSLVLLLICLRSLLTVAHGQVAVVERLGVYRASLHAGLHILVPFLDSVRARIDLAEQVVRISAEPVLTRDGAQVDVSTEFRYRVADPVRATYQLGSFERVERVAREALHSAASALTRSELAGIPDQLRAALDGASEAWGLRIEGVMVNVSPAPIGSAGVRAGAVE